MAERDSWRPDSKNLTSVSWNLFPRIMTTKYVNEDIFNHLRDIRRASKNKKLDSHRVFYEAHTAKILQCSADTDGYRHLRVPLSENLQNCDVAAHKMTGNVFNPLKHEVDRRIQARDLLNPRDADSRWCPAGPTAMQRQASATHFLLHESLHSVPVAWLGQLMSKGLLFMRRSDGCVFLSLGFRGFTWIGWRCQRHESQGATQFFASAKADAYNILTTTD
eukprot:5680418-Alexandrium_andersonii.AAC.1